LKASSDPVDINRYDTLCDVNMSCMAAVDILNDLLCYEKLESGILELHKEYIVIQPFLRDCVSMFSVQARECDVTMSILTTAKEGMETEVGDAPSDDDQQLPMSLRPEDSIFADKFKMDQVVRNLISNALKFTPQGGSVTVHATFVPNTRDESMSTSQSRTVDTGLSTPYLSMSERNLISRDASDAGSMRGLVNFSAESQLSLRAGATTSTRSDLIQGKLVITVSDTGAGISEENQARLFKEIVQFSPEKLQSGGGSGLGLWITAGIMDLHDGKISVFSRGEGMGTSFTVEIPMTRLLNPDTSGREDPIPSPCPKPLRSERGRDRQFGEGGSSKILDALLPESLGVIMKYESNPALLCPSALSRSDLSTTLLPLEALEVLVVDDSRLNRKMLLKCLRADGHECSECADGREAVAAVKERINHSNGGKGKPFDAILMDYMMPNLDGPTATREIRALGYTSLIFGVTGNGTCVSFLSLLTSRRCCTDVTCLHADLSPLL
jgi:signal transduction histidine kinase